MLRLDVRSDISQVTRMLTDLQKKHVPAANARALNRAIDAVKSASVKEISAATKIQQKEIRPRLIVNGASAARQVAVLRAYPYSPNLSRFRATQNKRGVAATAWEGRKTYKGAFKMPSGRVVTRTTRERFPLKGLRGPSVPKTFLTKRVVSKMNQVAAQRWRAEFERELARRIANGR